MEKHIKKNFDSQFKSITTLNWLPWVGKTYVNKKTNRLLIVGESHYKWEEPGEDVAGYLAKDDFTRFFIYHNGLDFISGKERERSRLIPNLERALFYDSSPSEKMKLKLWESVCFYNFVQRTLESRETTDRPEDSDWRVGWETFFKVVDIVLPNYILFCGVKASDENGYFNNFLNLNNYKSDGIIRDKKKVNNTFSRYTTIKKDGNYEVPLVFIQHPSTRFSHECWADFLYKHWPDFFEELCAE